MLKIIQATPEPVQIQQRFSVTGTANPNDAGKQLIIAIDNQLKITGPTVTSEGLWRIDISFQDPGSHRLAIALDTEKVELAIQVMAATPGGSVSSVSVNTAMSGVPTLEQLVRLAYEQGYSDIHLGVGKIPRFRDQRQIEITHYPETDETTFFKWLREVLREEDIRRFQDTLDFDGAAQYQFVRVRLNVFVTLKGPAMVLRLIPTKIRTIEELSLPSVFKDICNYKKGLVLITGPTGCGKSTTLAAMLDYINQQMTKHIITIEDPIEFVHESRKSLINQREIGTHTLDFHRALKAALREDPDIIAIGEMRDRSTVSTVLKATQTGCLVFGMLHVNTTVTAIEHFLSFYNLDEQEQMRIQFADALVAVIAQALVRTRDGRCAAVHEVMLNIDPLKDYIKQGDIEEIEATLPRSDFYGMCSMNQSLKKLYEAGRVTQETALEASPRQNELAIMLQGSIGASRSWGRT